MGDNRNKIGIIYWINNLVAVIIVISGYFSNDSELFQTYTFLEVVFGTVIITSLVQSIFLVFYQFFLSPYKRKRRRCKRLINKFSKSNNFELKQKYMLDLFWLEALYQYVEKFTKAENSSDRNLKVTENLAFFSKAEITIPSILDDRDSLVETFYSIIFREVKLALSKHANISTIEEMNLPVPKEIAKKVFAHNGITLIVI